MKATTALIMFLACFELSGQTSRESRAGAIEGVVLSDTAQPLAGMLVYAAPISGAANGMRLQVATNSEGKFFLANLRSGTFRVHAFNFDLGFPDTGLAFYNTNPQGEPIVEVMRDSVVDTTVRIGKKCAYLMGVVKDDQDGLSVRAAQFKLTRSDDEKIWISTAPVNAAGTFKLAVPSLTSFRMKVSADHYEPWYSNRISLAVSGGDLTLAPSQELKLVIRLKRTD